MANTLAYYDMATITAVKSFIVQAPGVQERDKKRIILIFKKMNVSQVFLARLKILEIFQKTFSSLPHLIFSHFNG